MKTLYYWSVFSCLFCINEAHSYFISHSTSLGTQIKTNPTKESEPASYFTKLAGVYFIKNDSGSKSGSGGHDIKNDPKSCPSGTTWYEGHCEKNCDTNAYPYADTPDKKKGNIVYEVCQGNIRFGYNACNDGWVLNGGKCDVNPCTGYVYSSRPDRTAGTIDQCKSGDEMKYKYTACNEGWDLSNGYCNVHSCSTTTYPYTSNPGSTAGTVISCKTGTSYKYGYSVCNNGWYKSGGSCYENACTGYPSASSVISNCMGAVSCKKGTVYVYKCVLCNSGYEVSNGVCTATICPTGKVNLYVCPMWKCLVPSN